jgi:hypothetical protein
MRPREKRREKKAPLLTYPGPLAAPLFGRFRGQSGHSSDRSTPLTLICGRPQLAVLRIPLVVREAPGKRPLAGSATRMAPVLLEHICAYKPDVIMPTHHDAQVATGHLAQWWATEPLFQAMKDENSDIVIVSKEYREPVCFNTELNIQPGCCGY